MLILLQVNHERLMFISDWVFQLEMILNSYPGKQVEGTKFSKKMKLSHPFVYSNSIPVRSTSVHKHLGMCVNDKLS